MSYELVILEPVERKIEAYIADDNRFPTPQLKTQAISELEAILLALEEDPMSHGKSPPPPFGGNNRRLYTFALNAGGTARWVTVSYHCDPNAEDGAPLFLTSFNPVQM